MIQWRIYYADGSTFDSHNGTPFDAPGRGVLCIAYRHVDLGRRVIHRNDYYWWCDGQWVGGDLFGLFDYLIEPGCKTVKFGRTVSDGLYRTTFQRATNDRDLPRKSAWLPDEKL